MYLAGAVMGGKQMIRLPDSIIKKLDIRQGDIIEFHNEEGNITVKKHTPP